MNKTKIIKEIVGESLKEYGFSFLKTDGPCRIFVREAHGFKRYYDPETDVVKQYISIQEHRFCKSLIARFYTDADGNERQDELEVLKKYGTGGWLGYFDEDTYKRRLHILTTHIIEDGFDLLERKSIEKEITPTKAMAIKLFESHKELDERFIREYKMNPVPHSTSDIEDWFQKLKQMIISASEKPYEEVKGLLVEMAAFIGERNCELLGAKWFFEEELKTPRTQGEDHQGFGFLPLKEVVIHYRRFKEDKENAGTEYWFGNEMDELKKAFRENNKQDKQCGT